MQEIKAIRAVSLKLRIAPIRIATIKSTEPLRTLFIAQTTQTLFAKLEIKKMK